MLEALAEPNFACFKAANPGFRPIVQLFWPARKVIIYIQDTVTGCRISDFMGSAPTHGNSWVTVFRLCKIGDGHPILNLVQVYFEHTCAESTHIPLIIYNVMKTTVCSTITSICHSETFLCFYQK